jgi:hypothetical protein
VTAISRLQARAKRRLAVLERRRRDPRYVRVMGRFVREGLLFTNRDVPENRRPVAVEDVLFAGELEPRLLELLPALIIKRPAMFRGVEALPPDLAEAVRALRHDAAPPDFRGIPGQDIHGWLRRVGRKGKVPARLKAFRLRPEDQRLLSELSQRLDLSETDVIRRGLRALA